MKLKDNRGFVGVDVSIAVIILLILVPTIMGIIFYINSSQNITKVKSGALNIATNAIEVAKGMDLSKDDSANVEDIFDGLEDVYGDVYGNEVTIDTTNSPAVVNLGYAIYQLEITVTDYANNPNTTQQNVETGVVKTVTVSVKYKARGEEKTIDLSTVVK